VNSLTYLYCVVAAPRAPRVARAPRGLPGLGAPRVLEIDRELFAIVADAPRGRYNADAINRRLADLDWVSRLAVAHEALVEHFIDERAVLPTKLLTLFESDARTLSHLRAERARLAAAAKRVAGQLEWGVRVLFDGVRAAGEARPAGAKLKKGSEPLSGAAYLQLKRAHRNAREELTARAERTAAQVYQALARKARAARKRGSDQPPGARGTLLLDAAFLVPSSRTASFRALAARQARALAPKGYVITLTGPWPAYTFVRD
jgi:hypothetical protein